jgi:hypothetical protein
MQKNHYYSYELPDSILVILEEADFLGFDHPEQAMQHIISHVDWVERWDVAACLIQQQIQKLKDFRSSLIRKIKESKAGYYFCENGTEC